MAIPISCRICTDIVGVESRMRSLARSRAGNFDYAVDLDCPGKGNHPKARKTERLRSRGFIRQVTQEYPETCTTSSWAEYTGPPNKFCLWIAIVFGTRWASVYGSGIRVNGQWAWWSRELGLYGEGVQALTASQQQAT